MSSRPLPAPGGELGARLRARHPQSMVAIVTDERHRQGLTVEQLAARVAVLADTRGLSGAGLSSATKHLTASAPGSPSITLMDLVAEVLGISPQTFAEYRLAQARAALDETRVGIDAALAALAAGPNTAQTDLT